MHEIDWAQPNPQALLEVTDPPLPDDEALLSELGAHYPVVSYPASQQCDDEDSEIERTIYGGLVWP